MLSPGFIGVPVLPGQRSILLRYEPGIWKLIMAFAGLLLALVAMAAERRGYLARLGFEPAGGAEDRKQNTLLAKAPIEVADADSRLEPIFLACRG